MVGGPLVRSLFLEVRRNVKVCKMSYCSHIGDSLYTLKGHEKGIAPSIETNEVYKEYINYSFDLKTLLTKESLSSVDEGVMLGSGPRVRPRAPDAALSAVRADTTDQHLATHSCMKRHKYLVMKYVQRWKALTDKRKEDVLRQTRKDTVNNFLDKLQKKKCTSSDAVEDKSRKSNIMVRDFRTYQHRYLVQKHIIALQKAKLEEQKKVIEELKLNKIASDSSESLVRIKEEVRKTYSEIDRKLKPKLQSLSKELKITELEEPTMVLNCLKVPQFLKRMEARAREREEKHAVIRERRRQLDEERARTRHQEELEKAEMDKEEKNRRIQLLREKRMREKVENIRKRQHAERARALAVMAELHYERGLMAKYGIRPLRLLVQLARRSADAADEHSRHRTMRTVFLHWMWHAEDARAERYFKADQLYRRKLLERAFLRLKHVHRAAVLRRQVAEDYNDLRLARAAFRALRAAVDRARAERAARWSAAVAYYHSNLMFKTFTCWRALPALNALKREQEARKSKWRQKVLLVVPDYVPPDE